MLNRVQTYPELGPMENGGGPSIERGPVNVFGTGKLMRTCSPGSPHIPFWFQSISTLTNPIVAEGIKLVTSMSISIPQVTVCPTTPSGIPIPVGQGMTLSDGSMV